VVLAAQAVSVALVAQAVLVGLVVPSPRAVAARGRTTLRIEAVPPTVTSGPPTSSVDPPAVKGNEGPAPATGLPAVVRGKPVRARATGLRVPVRGSVVPGRVTGLVLGQVTGPVLEAALAVTRLAVATSLEMVDPAAEMV